jgi:hypothetical protein
VVDLIDNWKNEVCARPMLDAEDSCSEWTVTTKSQNKKIRCMSRENSSDAGLNTREERHRCLREIRNNTRVEISDRFSQLQKLESSIIFTYNVYLQ